MIKNIQNIIKRKFYQNVCVIITVKYQIIFNVKRGQLFKTQKIMVKNLDFFSVKRDFKLVREI